VRLSDNHTLNGRPFTDICDYLAGKYPKDFKFIGWHPQCRCYAIPILKTTDEMFSDAPSENEVKDMPENFKRWVEANAEKIQAAEERGKLPYFLADNKKYIEVKSGGATPKTLADYQNIPTLKNLQPLIDEYYDKKKGAPILWEAGNEEKMKEIMLDLFENSDFGMGVDVISRNGVEVLDDILNSYFKNQIETGTSNGMFKPNLRKEASKTLFGTDIAKAKPADYEKYGYLMDRNILKNYTQNKGAGQYGAVQIRFRKDKVTTTFTMADSLDNKGHLMPSLTSGPKLSSFGDVNEATNLFYDILDGTPIKTGSASDFTNKYARGYIELQYHGKLGVDAIESIFIPHSELYKVNMTTLNRFKGKFKVYTNENGKLKEIF
jgi:hypothetical protein